MSKPNESGYNRFRRFLIANRGRTITTRLVKDAILSSENSVSAPSPKNVNQTALWASRYENIISHKGGESETLVPTNYRPEKQCYYCASIVFHSYSFDLPWVEFCPIHDEELSDICGKCNQKWPRVTSLAKRDCDVCGIGLDGKLFSRRNYPEHPYELYELLSGHEKLRMKIHENEFPLAYFNLNYSNRKLQYRRINQHSYLSVSVLNLYKLIPATAFRSLVRQGFEYDEFESFEFNLTEPVKRNGLPDKLPQELCVIAEKKSLNEIRESLQTGMRHEIGSCTNPDKACIRCASWHLWKYKFIEHTGDWTIESVRQWKRHIERLYGTPYQPELLEIGSVFIKHDSQNKDIGVDYDIPRYIQKEIRTQDLKTAFLNMYWYISLFKKSVGKQVSYSPMEVAASMPFYAHPLRACPTNYLIRIKKQKATLFIPNLILSDCISDMDFFYARTYESYKNQSMQDVLRSYDM